MRLQLIVAFRRERGQRSPDTFVTVDKYVWPYGMSMTTSQAPIDWDHVGSSHRPQSYMVDCGLAQASG